MVFIVKWYLQIGNVNLATGGMQLTNLPYMECLALWISTRDQLGGGVEINETFVGGESTGKRGRGAEGKTLVLIAAEDTSKGIGRTLCVYRHRCIWWCVESDYSTHDWRRQHHKFEWMVVQCLKTVDNRYVKEEDTVDQIHLVAALLKRWLTWSTPSWRYQSQEFVVLFGWVYF